MVVAMKSLLLSVTLAVTGIQAVPVAQLSPPSTPQADAPMDEAPLVPFQWGAVSIPFGPKPSGCSKLELIIGL